MKRTQNQERLPRCRAALLLLLLVPMLLSTGCGQQAESTQKGGSSADRQTLLTEVYDHVFDAGTYTTLDYSFASDYINREYDNVTGGCSAAAKIDSAGDTIVGRNLDLNISNKNAYIVRTSVEGCYRTVGLAYVARELAPDYKEVQENGISSDFSKVLPFLTEDVLNEKGLYVEVNMRRAEFWPTGDPKYYCSGTNPNAEEKVYLFVLARYIAEHCATVDEVLEYIETLNLCNKKDSWNYSFLIADAGGHYGVLEFAQNRIFWSDGQSAHTNFYIEPSLAKFQELKVGVGRYETLVAGLDAVDDESAMFALLDSVSFFQYYSEDCQFDVRSEGVGLAPYATYEELMKEENRAFIMKLIEEVRQKVAGKSRQELMDANEFWESVYTAVVNCNNRTIHVRFNEDDEKIIDLSVE